MDDPTKNQPTPQAPRLPGLTIDELKSLLGDKEVLIMQLHKQLRVYQEQMGVLAQELQAKEGEIAKLRSREGKAKKGGAEEIVRAVAHADAHAGVDR